MTDIFYYELLNASGGVERGIKQVPTSADVRAALEAVLPGSVLLRCVRLCRGESWFGRMLLAVGRGSVKRGEAAALLRDVAVMVECGMPIFDAVRDVRLDRARDGSRGIRRVCAKLEADLFAGSGLTAAVARHPHVFSETVRSLISIGEETGALGQMMGEAAKHLERIESMRSSVLQSMIYPAISGVSVLAAGAFWVVYVMPKLSEMFRQFNATLPKVTVFAIELSRWIANSWLLLVVLALLGSAALTLAWRRSDRFRLFGFRLLHRLPIVSKLVSGTALAMLCEHLSILLKSGIDVMKALQILEGATADRYMREQLMEVRRIVEQGDQLSRALRTAGGFPTLLTRLVELGERSGSLDSQLRYLAKLYSDRLDLLIGSLAEILKPAVIVLVGGVFAFFVVAFMLPVYELIQQSMGGIKQ